MWLKSRAALSLLAYCYFQIQDYVNASDCYEQLTQITPDNEEYKINYAQCLYKCGLYEQAMKVAAQIDNPKYQAQVSYFSCKINSFKRIKKEFIKSLTKIYRR